MACLSMVSSPGLTEVGPARLRHLTKWSKSEASDFDWPSSKHRPWILGCPVKPGNDSIVGVRLIEKCFSAADQGCVTGRNREDARRGAAREGRKHRERE